MNLTGYVGLFLLQMISIRLPDQTAASLFLFGNYPVWSYSSHSDRKPHVNFCMMQYTWRIDTMTFYETLDSIMKQDFGGRGLLASLPVSPLAAVSTSLAHAKRAILLTGFPVRMPDGSVTGETDGPSGTANLAAALLAAGCGVSVVTDWSSYPHLEAALRFRAPQATLIRLPEQNTDDFIRTFIHDARPTHLISLERPGKAENGHYHSMRGEQLDDMITDSSLFLPAAKEAGATVISIGDGGNEMGMGTFRREILAGVPHGDLICTAEAADLTLASGVSNWWGWGIASLLSLKLGRNLLPSDRTEAELLRRVVAAGGVDGCTKKAELTVDALPLETHLGILQSVRRLTDEMLAKQKTPCFYAERKVMAAV